MRCIDALNKCERYPGYLKIMIVARLLQGARVGCQRPAPFFHAGPRRKGEGGKGNPLHYGRNAEEQYAHGVPASCARSDNALPFADLREKPHGSHGKKSAMASTPSNRLLQISRLLVIRTRQLAISGAASSGSVTSTSRGFAVALRYRFDTRSTRCAKLRRWSRDKSC
jgi:hypothetical protein